MGKQDPVYCRFPAKGNSEEEVVCRKISRLRGRAKIWEGDVDSGEILDGKTKGGERNVRKVVNMSASGKPKYAPMTKSFDITIFVSPSIY